MRLGLLFGLVLSHEIRSDSVCSSRVQCEELAYMQIDACGASIRVKICVFWGTVVDVSMLFHSEFFFA